MTDGEKELIRNLLDGWEGASHNADTYLQIAEKVPSYQDQVAYWRDDPVRREMTEARFRPIRLCVEAWLAGAGDSSLQRLIAEMQPRKPD
jgi:hypothetical protein